MSLDLNKHLLEAPDGLVATLLWQLVLHVVLAAVAVLAALVLRVFIRVGGKLVLGILESSAGSLLSINARRGTLLLVTSGEVSGISWVTRAAWVGSLGGIADDFLGLLLAKGRLVVELLLEVVAGKVWNIVPCVVVGRPVDLRKLLVGWVDLGGGLLCCVTCDITKEDGGIAHCESVSGK